MSAIHLIKELTKDRRSTVYIRGKKLVNAFLSVGAKEEKCDKPHTTKLSFGDRTLEIDTKALVHIDYYISEIARLIMKHHETTTNKPAAALHLTLV